MARIVLFSVCATVSVFLLCYAIGVLTGRLRPLFASRGSQPLSRRHQVLHALVVFLLGVAFLLFGVAGVLLFDGSGDRYGDEAMVLVLIGTCVTFVSNVLNMVMVITTRRRSDSAPSGYGWLFNPPPGWPAAPPGWRPPEGWYPDPNLPAAPIGWQWWLPNPARDWPPLEQTKEPAQP